MPEYGFSLTSTLSYKDRIEYSFFIREYTVQSSCILYASSLIRLPDIIYSVCCFNIPLSLTLTVEQQTIHKITKNFLSNLNYCNYTEKKKQDVNSADADKDREESK